MKAPAVRKAAVMVCGNVMRVVELVMTAPKSVSSARLASGLKV
jgi:hypothetical protein